MPIVPGIGYAGLGQQNPANQLVFRKGMSRSGNGTRKRRSARVSVKRTPKKRAMKAHGTRRRRANGKRLVKGSAAAKRRMAKIRKMRR